MADEGEDKPTLGSRLLRAGRTFVAHPCGQFVLFITFLYQVKECYPFTHVPMYSDPEAAAPYWYLADGEGKGIGVRAHCGVTNPKMRKMLRSRLEDYCKENGLDHKNPPRAAVDKIAGDVFEFLRERAEARGRPLPPDLRLMHVLIEPSPDGYSETATLYAAEEGGTASP